MSYRIDKEGLLNTISAWDGFLKRKVHLIACGGTALTLLDIKASTELLESPIEKQNNILVKEFSHVYLGVLNYYDIIISKLSRGAAVDMEDCLALMRDKKNKIDLRRLTNRFQETAAYDVAEEKMNNNLEYFLKILRKEGLNHEKK